MKATKVESEPIKALRILLVEDDPLIGALLADVLKNMGHDVCAIVVTQEAAVTAASQSLTRIGSMKPIH